MKAINMNPTPKQQADALALKCAETLHAKGLCYSWQKQSYANAIISELNLEALLECVDVLRRYAKTTVPQIKAAQEALAKLDGGTR